ncbi:MAG: hypothetical protein AAB621_02830 [Patescibacteria group bacterium]
MFYFTISSLVAISAVVAVFVAKKAMKRGLTYSAMSATVWALVFIAISRVWHTLRELLNLEVQMGDLPEIIEYTLLFIAFIVFVWLANKTNSIKTS